jgi:hypothetical protein
MREQGGKSDEPRLGINRSRLDGCDFMLAQGLAHDLKTTRKRRIAERAGSSRGKGEWIIAVSVFSGFFNSPCALARAVAIAAIDSLER